MTVKSNNVEVVAGRPRSSRDSFVAAAVALLKVKGIAFTLEDVAIATGKRRQTIYNHFGSKEALLQEAVVKIRDELVLPFSDMEGPPPLVLGALAQAVMAHFFEPGNFRVLSMLSAAAYEIPEIATWLKPRQDQPLSTALARYLQTQADAGGLSIPDPKLAAQLFLGSLTGYYHARVVFGEAAPDAAQQTAVIKACLTTFLAAWGHDPRAVR